MSGICSQHQHREIGCKICEALPDKEVKTQLKTIFNDRSKLCGMHTDWDEERLNELINIFLASIPNIKIISIDKKQDRIIAIMGYASADILYKI